LNLPLAILHDLTGKGSERAPLLAVTISSSPYTFCGWKTAALLPKEVGRVLPYARSVSKIEGEMARWITT
jgi:hypothetical protein